MPPAVNFRRKVASQISQHGLKQGLPIKHQRRVALHGRGVRQDSTGGRAESARIRLPDVGICHILQRHGRLAFERGLLAQAQERGDRLEHCEWQPKPAFFVSGFLSERGAQFVGRLCHGFSRISPPNDTTAG